MRTRHGLIAAGGVALGVVLGAGIGFKAGCMLDCLAPVDQPGPGLVSGPGADTGGQHGGHFGWRVLRVIDGDTLVIDGYDGDPTSVRLLGIDAPERGEPGHAEATAGLRDLVERGGGVVWLVFDPAANRGRKRDNFGRLLCRVEVQLTDGGGGQPERVDVGAALKAQGLAREFRR